MSGPLRDQTISLGQVDTTGQLVIFLIVAHIMNQPTLKNGLIKKFEEQLASTVCMYPAIQAD